MSDMDVDAVIALWSDCGLTRPWNDAVKDIAFARGKPNSDVLVGEVDGALVASAMVGHDGHRGMLYYLAVAPAEQGRGYGRAMVEAAERWLKERGVWKINLLVRTENAKVKGFYESLGYEISDVFCMARRILR
jgi:ribosomal protein S18 acetylase RimI-like enzyme